MNRFAKLTHVDTQSDFALLLESNGKVSAAGSSKIGQNWARWLETQPTDKYRTLDQVIRLLGSHISVAEIRKPTREDNSAFAGLRKQQSISTQQ